MMKQRVFPGTAFLFLITLAVIVTARLIITENNLQGEQLGVKTSINSFSLPEFNQQTFQRNLNTSLEQPKNSNQIISAAVVPHHDIAGTMIANVLTGARKQGITQIIIIGPNHEERGAHNIITTNYNWETPFGMVLNNQEVTKQLTQSNLIKIEDGVFENEQSIYTLTPYIKTILPEASVSAIVLKNRTSKEEEEQVSQLLASKLSPNTLLLASVDFSHYLPKQEADQNDKQTLSAIEQKDLQKIREFNSDFVDAPSVLSVLIQTMKLAGKENIKMVDHKNSSDIQNRNFENTTSYYQLEFF